MPKIIKLRRDDKEVQINADQIQFIEPHPSEKGTLIHFVNGDEMHVDETTDSVRSRVNGPAI